MAISYAAWATIEKLNLKIAKQAEEIATLKARDACLVQDNPFPRGVTVDEMGTLWERHNLSALLLFLRSKGLLIEDTPKSIKFDLKEQLREQNVELGISEDNLTSEAEGKRVQIEEGE